MRKSIKALTDKKETNRIAYGVLICLFVFLSSSDKIFAQTDEKIAIGVIDEYLAPITGKALQIAYCSDKPAVFITDERGMVMVPDPRPSGCGELRIRGGRDLTASLDTLVLLNETSGKIIIQLHSVVLKDVEVIGYRKKVEADAAGISYKIEPKDYPKFAKADILLQSTPGLLFGSDGYKLFGNSEPVKFYINGIEASEREVSNLKVSDIREVRIRRIGTDESGNQGELDIVLKEKLHPQIKADLPLSTSLTNLSVGTYPMLFLKLGKVEFTGIAGYRQDNQKSSYSLTQNDVKQMEFSNRTRLNQLNGDYRLNWFISPQWMTSISFSHFGYNESIQRQYLYPGETNGLPESINGEHANNVANAVVKYAPDRNNRFFLKGRLFNYYSTNEISGMAHNGYSGRLGEWSGEV